VTVLRRIFRRGPWEALATLLIVAGVLMLMQPVSLTLYGWSFATMLSGVVLFTIVSKFPD
jgi:drug/metabolite transporter (DMT)-like permease